MQLERQISSYLNKLIKDKLYIEAKSLTNKERDRQTKIQSDKQNNLLTIRQTHTTDRKTDSQEKKKNLKFKKTKF